MHDHYFKTIIHQKTRGIGIKLLVGEKWAVFYEFKKSTREILVDFLV